MKDLDAAVATHEACTDCRHERAYLNIELGNYGAAITDLDYEIKARPDFESGYHERAFARSYNGDLEGAYQDRKRAVELKPDSLENLKARGEAALWTGRFDAAAADFKKVEAAAKKAGDESNRTDAAAKRASVELWRGSIKDKDAPGRCVMQDLKAGDARLKALISDCSAAFFAAQDGPARAAALSTRSTIWPMLGGSWDLTTVDRRVAAGLDPKNPEHYVNLGWAYIAVRHSRAAIQEFDRAIALKPSPLALAGRAQAHANVGENREAFADAKASFEMQANGPALSVAADLTYDRGDKDQARDMYLGAYQLGLRDDRLVARLKELGVDDPEKAIKDAAK
jgi:tetratricopeptide (TPR) repeat protein